VAQSRADWGLAIESVARSQGLGFLPLQDEQYDFATPHSRRGRPAVAAFAELLTEPEVREHLRSLGLVL
jgi:putative molybdopterin biosynthesis protein